MKKIIYIVLLVILLLTVQLGSVNASSKIGPFSAEDLSTADGYQVYLPVISNTTPQNRYRVNAPLLSDANWITPMSIFWFGNVSNTENYVDVRVGYTTSEIIVRFAVIDRYIWYDETPTRQELTQFDAAVVYLNTSGIAGTTPALNTYRFVAQQFPNWLDQSSYKAAYRGDGNSWQLSDASFTIKPIYRGETGFNQWGNQVDNKGWIITFNIPFSSLGLSGPPPQGTTWGIATMMYDRDNPSVSATSKVWPPEMKSDDPTKWADLGFGLPVSTPADHINDRAITIHQGLNATSVPDASVGGSTVCGLGSDYLGNWGDKTESFYADRTVKNTQFNIQNQGDISDWPCFSKYYVTFPLDALPKGKVIVSAKLVLYEFGNSGAPGDAEESYIQVMSADSDWDENTLTWNNAPLALENYAGAVVQPVLGDPGILGVPYEWNISTAVERAYNSNQPLRLALYSSDSAMHSGKYFWASNRLEEPSARPTIMITYGDSN